MIIVVLHHVQRFIGRIIDMLVFLHVMFSSSTWFIYLIIPLQQCWRGYSNAAVRVWLNEWVHVSICHTLPFGHYADYSFGPIAFNLHR